MEGHHPGLGRLERYLAGGEPRIIRPPARRELPARDLYGPRPQAEETIEDILGREHFTPPDEPERDDVLYSIGEMARVLGRKPQVVRCWIKDGVIPEAIYWQGDKRRFTERQVMGLLSLLEREGLLGRERYDFARTGFSARAWDMWHAD